MSKIGLLLGSFDPVTAAHVAIAACAVNSGLCDKVLFVVAKHNPWKKEEPAPFDLRCKMIEEAIKPFGDKLEVCRFEEKHEPQFIHIYQLMKLSKYIKVTRFISLVVLIPLTVFQNGRTLKLISKTRLGLSVYQEVVRLV